MKKRKLNVKKLIRFIILLLVIILLIYFLIIGIKKLFNNKNDVNDVNIVDTIKSYTLDENETSYYKNLFSQLKNELNKSSINEEEYAKIISKLFISDFFTLDNKISKNDIGGTQFVYKEYRNDFEKYAKDTIYHSLKNNLYNNRNQELPIVHSVDITKITQGEYKYLEKVDSNAYFIDLSITYEKDLGYQKKASLVLVHNDDLLEIVKMD